MATSAARKEAQSALGKFNTSGYEGQRKAATNMYDTSIAEANNQWTNLQNQLNIQRGATANNFSQGRANTAETQYLANRAAENRRRAGGVTDDNSTLSNISSRMALDKQYSDLANTYYDSIDEINRNQALGETEYNTAKRVAQDTLNASLADIDLAQQQGQNNYNQAVANLAEQIQSRWDAAAQAASQLAAVKENNRLLQDQAIATEIQGITQGLSSSSSTDDLIAAYNALAAYGLSDSKIQDILNGRTGRNDIYYNGKPTQTKINTSGLLSNGFNTSLGNISNYVSEPILNTYAAKQQELQDRLNRNIGR